MASFGRAPPGQSILGTLQVTDIDNRPTLPAEILACVLDYLPIPDLMRCARTSRRMREMVYEDSRWVARLKSMGCWDEAAARRRFDEAVRRKREAAARQQRQAPGGAGAPPLQGAGPGAQGGPATTLFDASIEEDLQRRRQQQQQAARAQQAAATVPGADGFVAATTSAGGGPPASDDPSQNAEALLSVLSSAQSVRGHAREEYGRIYGALAPFYYDLLRAQSHAEPVVFRVFRDPERQAQMLANLVVFARSDWASGWHERSTKLDNMVSIFESAVVREFEQGYEFWDIDGRMHRYAHVLERLNGGRAAVDLFVAKHPIFSSPETERNPIECINLAASDDVNLEPSSVFFSSLAGKLNEQSAVVARIFPRPAEAFWIFVDKVREDIIAEYTTPLFDEAHERSMHTYLKAVSGVFEQCLQFLRSLQPPNPDPAVTEEKILDVMRKLFEPHLDLYLQEELDYFTRNAEAQVADWEKKLSEQDATVESFYMSHFTRQADKKDFLSSFKKVVMMPVTVLETIPLPIPTLTPFGSSKPAAAPTLTPTPVANGNSLQGGSPQPSRPHSPSVLGTGIDRKASPLPEKAPTDELAAKAALMASRLEGIKSLFSLEVALNLTHAANASHGRAAVFVALGGQAGGEAREQCLNIFVTLLRVLGNRHVRSGFDRAVAHLASYKAREVAATDHGARGGVAPLVTFIELVNVGDLISQMIDVFYEQQLAGHKISNKNDFLDPAVLAKKKFEQMLDESVAAGLNKGIDVLMDEVEYLCATTQKPGDYNPEAAGVDDGAGAAGAGSRTDKRASMATAAAFSDVGPSETAQRIVDLVRSHTRMLVGSTDKSMLDVFNGEVGLRLFTAVCKHLKRQRISTTGAVTLISDMNLYFEYVRSLRNQDLLPYFRALRELSQVFLIDAKHHAKEMATIIADGDRFQGVFRAEEVYEYAQRRADWYHVRRDVERAMYGMECTLM